MIKVEKLSLLEEILDVEKGTLEEEISLQELAAWDSLAKITFMASIEDNFNKIIEVVELRKCHTVKDLLAIME